MENVSRTRCRCWNPSTPNGRSGGDYAHELALCQLGLGLEDEALETAAVLDADPSHPGARLLRADIEFQRANYTVSLAHLRAIDAANTANVGWLNLLGLNYLRLHQWAPAEEAFRRVLTLDADDPHAHLGLAHGQVRTRRFEEAAGSALRAVGLRFELPMGHYHLGLALARLGDDTRAIQALETCLRYQPDWAPAHRYLAILHARRPGVESSTKSTGSPTPSRRTAPVAGRPCGQPGEASPGDRRARPDTRRGTRPPTGRAPAAAGGRSATQPGGGWHGISDRVGPAAVGYVADDANA